MNGLPHATRADALIQTYMEGNLSEQQERELRSWLAENPEHMREFVRQIQLDLALWNLCAADLQSHRSKPLQHTRPKARSIFRSLAAPLAAAASLTIVAGVWWFNQGQAAGLGLRVAEATGEVNIRHSTSNIQHPSGEGKAVKAVVGMKLRQGDRVVVGKGGMAGLKYDGEETKIDLMAATEAAFGSETGAKRVRLDGGMLVCSAAPQKKPFEIKTRHATARVVGTRFSLGVIDPRTVLAVMEGKVALCQGEKILEVSAGQEATATATGMALGTGTAGTEPQTGTPVSEIRLGAWDARVGMFRRLWWNPLDLTLEGEMSRLTPGGKLELFRWSTAGTTGQPVSFLGSVAFDDTKRVVRLADGRLLGLQVTDSRPTAKCMPVELQPQVRALGPAVELDAAFVSMTACDRQGRYFMVAMKGAPSHVVIWDLKRNVLAADLTDLPRTPHRLGDYGFMACAVAPDAGLGVVVDSGGGLLVLDLPSGTVRHRLALPMPESVQEYGLDLAWENGELVCRGWPSKEKGTVRVDPVAGTILERLDHPVIRGGETTVHVRGNELEVLQPGTAPRRIAMPPMKVGTREVTVAADVGGWSCSPDGRWLAGTPMAGATQVLVDLREGRCVSPER